MNLAIRNHFKKNDPILYSVSELIEWKERINNHDHFIELVESIISQQLSIKASDAIFGRLKKLFKNKVINPQGLLKLSYVKIRSAGISGSKIAYLKDLAQKIVNKEIDFESFTLMSDQEIITELIKIKGVGRWTAEMFLMGPLGREDVFSYGDLGIRKAIQKLYNLKKQPTQKQAEIISKKWAPYRTFACRVLWKSLELK